MRFTFISTALTLSCLVFSIPIEAGLKKNQQGPSANSPIPARTPGKYFVGQRIKTRLYGEVEILKVTPTGVVIQKLSKNGNRYDPFPVAAAEFDTLSETEIPQRERRKMEQESDAWSKKQELKERELASKRRQEEKQKAAEAKRERLIAENYQKNKRELDRIKATMDRLAPKIHAIEREMLALGAQVGNMGYSNKTVTGIECDRQNQNCRNTYQGGGETGSSYFGRKNREERIQKLDSERRDLVLQYDRLAREYNQILEGK